MLLYHPRLAAFSAAFVCGLVGGAVAQAPPANPPASPPAPATPAPSPSLQSITVMVVDVQAVLQNSKAAKMVRSQIEQKREEYAKEINPQMQALDTEREALRRQLASLEAEKEALEHQQGSAPAEAFEQKKKQFEQKANDFKKKGREFEQKSQEVQAATETKLQTLRDADGDASVKIRDAMKNIINEIAQQRKPSLIVLRPDVLSAANEFDVTDEVLQKLDEQMPTLSVSFNPPATPASSAAPASTSPAPSSASSAPAKHSPKPKNK